MYDLRRTKASGFCEDKSIDLKYINEQNQKDKLIIPIADAMDHLPKIHLKRELDILYWKTGRKIKFKSEKPIKNHNQLEEQKLLVLDKEYKLLGIGIHSHKDFDFLQPKLVLNAQ